MNKILKISLSVFVLTVISLLGIPLYSEKSRLSDLYQEVVVKGRDLSFTRSSSEFEFISGGLRLRGSLYMPRGKGPFPGVVLAHGGTKLGRKLALYRVLGKKLSQRGYVVLSFDFRGFGESEDPVKFEDPSDLDFVADVFQAVSYLSSVKRVDPSNISLVGHSFGAGVVIPAGIQDERVKSVVAIAPGRRGYELFWSENAPYKQFPQTRLAQDMEIQPLPMDFLYPILQKLTVDIVLDYPSHPPILLIDGSLEDPQDLLFLRNLYEKMTEPKGYTTIQNTGHYFGTRRNDSGFYNFVTYHRKVLESLVGVIDNWLRRNL